jgi:hypothetical protein
MTTIQKVYTWTTKEGVELEIEKMATPHLLSTIHMLERNRMNNLLSLVGTEWTEETVEYYAQWSPEYFALVEEAQKRLLINRPSQKEGIVKHGKTKRT